jgi:hypothetical protein
MSVGKCVRIALMIGLHQLDVNSGTPQNQNWIDAEEGRRTFWASYFADRYASTLSKRPFSYQDADVSYKPARSFRRRKRLTLSSTDMY